MNSRQMLRDNIKIMKGVDKVANYSPQTNYFNTSQKWNKAYNISYWLILVLSIAATFLHLNMWIECVSIFAIIYLNIISYISENYKLKAEKIRRADFIDNSFGTKFVHDSSDAYYDNDELDFGTRKSMTNLFENSYFSYNVSKEMIRKKSVNNFIFTVIILGLAIYGFSRSNISLPLLQVYLSRYFILEYLKLNSFHQRAESCFDDLKRISVNMTENRKLTASEIQFIKTLIDYEAGIAESNIVMDSKIFNEMNAQLTIEWEKMKIKYITGGDENEC